MKTVIFRKTIILSLALFLAFIAQNGFSQSMQAIYEQNKSCIVMIEAPNEKGDELKTGTGFFINEFGTILTNYHVVEKSHQIFVLYNNKKYEADLIDFWEVYDMAFLLIKTDQKTPYVKVNPAYDRMNMDLPNVLDPILVIGHPLALNLSANEGTISSIYGPDNEAPGLVIMQTDAAINPGNSGGPIFNKNGVVIGVATKKMSGIDVSGIGFIYSIDWLIKERPFIFQANARYMTEKYGGFHLRRPRGDMLLDSFVYSSRPNIVRIPNSQYSNSSCLVTQEDYKTYIDYTSEDGSYRTIDFSSSHYKLSLNDLIIMDIAGLNYIKINHPFIKEFPKTEYTIYTYLPKRIIEDTSSGTAVYLYSSINPNNPFQNYRFLNNKKLPSNLEAILNANSNTKFIEPGLFLAKPDTNVFDNRITNPDIVKMTLAWDNHRYRLAERMENAYLKLRVGESRYVTVE